MSKKKHRRGKAAVEARRKRLQGDSIRYKCNECGKEEDIPKSAIELIDILDEGVGMPEFKCKECNGIMVANEDEGETIRIVTERSSSEDDDDLWF